MSVLAMPAAFSFAHIIAVQHYSQRHLQLEALPHVVLVASQWHLCGELPNLE